MPPLKLWTVVGLVDDEDSTLYVSAVFSGKQEAKDKTLVTTFEGYGDLSRFVGYFDAEDAEMAEEIAVDVVSHYADYDAVQWAAQRPPRPYIEDVKTDKV